MGLEFKDERCVCVIFRGENSGTFREVQIKPIWRVYAIKTGALKRRSYNTLIKNEGEID